MFLKSGIAQLLFLALMPRKMIYKWHTLPGYVKIAIEHGDL